MEAKEQKMAELNQQLNKRKEQMDQLEKSLQKAGGSAAATTELSKKLGETQIQLDLYVFMFFLFYLSAI